MRRLTIGFVLLLALSPMLSAQVSSVSIQQNLNSATCPGSGCVALAVSGYGGIALQITGTYSGTVSFEGSVDGVTFTALNLTPTNSTTAATSTTSTGVWSGGMGGLTSVRARMSSYTSGTASVVLQAAPTAARAGSGGGGSPITCADTGVLFADGANNPACDAGLTYDKTQHTLTVDPTGFGQILTDVATSRQVTLSNSSYMGFDGTLDQGSDGAIELYGADGSSHFDIKASGYALLDVVGFISLISDESLDITADNITLDDSGNLQIDGTIQPGGYKSADGTSGATVTTCTGFKNGLCISGA